MFYFDEGKMLDMVSLVEKNISEMSYMENGYLENMSPISDSGLYGNGIQMIDSQIVSIKDGLTDFRNITRNNMQAVSDLERHMTKEVDNISLPKDFDAEDVGVSVDISNTYLNKIDGRSVNEGISSSYVGLTDQYDVNSKSLFELHKEELDGKKLDDYHDIDEKDLDKLKEERLVNNELDDYKYTQEKNLRNAKNYKDVYISSLDDDYDIEKEDLDEMTEGDVK